MALLENGQSCLEKNGIQERENEIVRSDYNEENPYGPTHKDAISDGDIMGKGTGHGGHTAWNPDCDKPNQAIDYSNFDTINGGGKADVDKRLESMARSLYNAENPYGATLVKTSENIAKGQYYFGQTIKHM